MPLNKIQIDPYSPYVTEDLYPHIIAAPLTVINAHIEHEIHFALYKLHVMTLDVTSCYFFEDFIPKLEHALSLAASQPHPIVVIVGKLDLHQEAVIQQLAYGPEYSSRGFILKPTEHIVILKVSDDGFPDECTISSW